MLICLTISVFSQYNLLPKLVTTVTVTVRPDLFYKLIYGRAYPKILAPLEKLNCHFEIYFVSGP